MQTGGSHFSNDAVRLSTALYLTTGLLFFARMERKTRVSGSLAQY